MLIKISPVMTQADEEAAWSVKREVFGLEMGIPMANLKLPSAVKVLQLLAREEESGRPVATLALIETSGDAAARARYGLQFRLNSRSVRYTQMSVLKPYRGLQLSLRLILEGHRLFVEPGHFDYSWLVFNAERASSSLLVQLLKFAPSMATVASDMGISRVLVRNEHAPECKAAIRIAEASLHSLETFPPPPYNTFAAEAQRAPGTR